MKAIYVQGLGFGDEGKGATVDYLCRQHKSNLVVRFNGGGQAAHNVVLPDGTHHTFSQFGSGTLAGAATHLSRYMLVDPLSLLKESKVLAKLGYGDALSRMTISPYAVIVTPFHWQTNQLIENSRGSNRHSSVGRGIGEAREDELHGLSLRMLSLEKPAGVVNCLAEIRKRKSEKLKSYGITDPFDSLNIFDLAKKYHDFYCAVKTEQTEYVLKQETSPVIFEGAQGVLLDEKHGLEPYNTWTDCTFGNAMILTPNNWDVEKVGVIRSYFTRHGSGPFPTEDSSLEYPEPHNVTHPFMGTFRQGRLDTVLLDYAIKAIGGVDTIAINHLDMSAYGKMRVTYSPTENIWSPDSITFRCGGVIGAIGSKAKNLILGFGPTYENRMESSSFDPHTIQIYRNQPIHTI